MVMQNYLWLIPFFPLLGFAINGLLGPRLGEKGVSFAGAGVVLASFIAGLFAFFDLISLAPESRLFTQSLYQWMAAGSFSVDIGR